MSRDQDTPLNDALERLSEEEDPRPTVGGLLEDLGNSSFGFALLAPALVVVTPLSGIPGVSSVCGIVIALSAAQMIAGRRHIWLPRFVRSRRIDRGRLEGGLGWVQRPMSWVDRRTHPRLEWLLRRPFVVVLQLVCLLCGAAMPAVELLPLTSSILGFVVLLLSVAMVARDGLVALAGLAIIAAAAFSLVGFLSG